MLLLFSQHSQGRPAEIPFSSNTLGSCLLPQLWGLLVHSGVSHSPTLVPIPVLAKCAERASPFGLLDPDLPAAVPSAAGSAAPRKLCPQEPWKQDTQPYLQLYSDCSLQELPLGSNHLSFATLTISPRSSFLVFPQGQPPRGKNPAAEPWVNPVCCHVEI